MDHGGILPEPKNAWENAALSALTPTGCHVLLGMTDRVNEGTWRWDSDRTIVTWTKWANWTHDSNEPNGQTQSNCAVLMNYYEPNHVIGSPLGIWGDMDCANNEEIPCRQIVCQKESE